MRLRQLNLLRYGHFTSFTLDFGEVPTNGSDFHIIFGENETGKSTAFNGYLDLLFGIEERSKYNFLHDYRTLRIGAILEINKKSIELSRIKQRSENLLGENGQPVDEEILISALHGLTRNSYQAMFSLNDETIERGGEEILASRGDIGRLLFAGAAGLSDLNEVIELLRECANKLYAERARTCEIATIHQDLKNFKEKRKELDISVNSYERLTETRQNAEKDYQSARSSLENIRKERLSLQKVKVAFEIRDQLECLEKKLKPINHLPDVPTDWVDEVKELQKKLAAAERASIDAQADIDTSNKKLDELVADPNIIKVQHELSEMAALKVRIQTAHERLPDLNADLSQINNELDEVRQRLGVDKTVVLADLVIPDGTIASLKTLAQQEMLLIQRLETVRAEASEAEETLSQATEDKKKATLPDILVMELVTLLDTYTKDDVQQRINLAGTALKAKSQKVNRKLAELIPWTGDRNGIKTITFPRPEQANCWHKKFDKLNEELDRRKMCMSQYNKDIALCGNRVTILIELAGVISDDCAASVRKERDTAWAKHRKTLDDETADIFETMLAKDDRIHNARLKTSDRLSELRSLKVDLAIKKDELNFIVDEINEIERDLQILKDEVAPILVNAGLPENFKIEDLSGWLERVGNVRDFIEEEDAYRNELDRALAEYNRRYTDLQEALAKVDKRPSNNLDLNVLCEIAKSYRNQATNAQALYEQTNKAVSEATSQFKRRHKALKDAEDKYEQWQKDWEDVLVGLWFQPRKVEQIRALLEPLHKLATLIANQKTCIKQIDAEKKHCDVFRSRVSTLVHLLDLEDQDDVAAQFSILQERLRNAQKTETDRETAATIKERANERLRKAKDDVHDIENQLKKMAIAFPAEEISSLGQLALVLEHAKQKRELVKEISDKDDHLLRQMEVKTRVDAELELETNNLQAIEDRLVKIDEDIKEAEKELERRIENRRDAVRATEEMGSDSGVALLNEKCQSLLLEISNKADRALSLHLGLMVADRALTVYRERHRSELLTHAAEAFTSITDGKFTNLAIQPDQPTDRLIALRSNGGSIAAGEMSKGTRFQLYLALRLAGFRRFCKERSALPFIGDDIMETFDEPRTEAAIRQFREIARYGQALYFTHHRHVCEIAKKVCGDCVTIHEIPKKLLN